MDEGLITPCSITTDKEVDVYSCDGNFGCKQALIDEKNSAIPFTPHSDTMRGAWRFLRS